MDRKPIIINKDTNTDFFFTHREPLILEVWYAGNRIWANQTRIEEAA